MGNRFLSQKTIRVKVLDVKVNQIESNDHYYQAVKLLVYITPKKKFFIVKDILFTFYFGNILFVQVRRGSRHRTKRVPLKTHVYIQQSSSKGCVP